MVKNFSDPVYIGGKCELLTCFRGYFHWLVMIMLCCYVFGWSHMKERASERKIVKFEIRVVHHLEKSFGFPK